MQVVTQDLVEKAHIGFGTKNLVYSPSSLEVALGMVSAGSKGETLKQLVKFLGSKSLEDLYFKSKSAKLMKIVSQNREEPLICLVNGDWVDKRFPIVPSYQQVLKKVYKTEAKSIDFQHKADQVRRDVNSWADKETKGLIKQIVPPTFLNSNTVLVFANALYFKAAWAQGFRFDQKMTRQKEFHLLNGDTVSVPFMMKTEKYYSYCAFNDYKILKIPYENSGESDGFSMYFILPHEKHGIKKLIDNLHANSDKMLDQLHFVDQRSVKLSNVMIPKFKFSYEFKASDAMKKVGVTRPFKALNELTGIVDSPEGDAMYVEKILQKCVIEIDEEGTEAAAVTLGAMLHASRPPISFIADHPFMFMIREKGSGNVLFIGVELDPLHSG